MQTVYILTVMMLTQLYTIVKTQTINMKWVNFILSELYHSKGEKKLANQNSNSFLYNQNQGQLIQEIKDNFKYLKSNIIQHTKRLKETP